jgi:iron complex outermembrane receptor protein
MHGYAADDDGSGRAGYDTGTSNACFISRTGWSGLARFTVHSGRWKSGSAMGRSTGRWCLLLTAAACALAAVAMAEDDQPSFIGGLTPLEDWVELESNPIQLVSQVERPSQPIEIRQPLELETRLADLSSLNDEIRTASLSSQNLRNLSQLDAPPTSDVVGRGQVATAAPTDLGSLLQKSDDVQTVGAQRRSQIAFDPHIRGYRFGEIYTQAAGEYFLPVRLDLDSMLSKIDPYLIQKVTVIPGPYGLRYGPGFAFIDVTPIDTPRSQCGPTWNNRASVMTRGNGSQIFGQDTLSGGGQNYGFISGYGLKTGSDYAAGNGQRIPSSYHSQNVLMQYGWDTANGRVEARYNRFDLWNTEYALEFFDVNSLQTDSFNLNYAGTDEVSGANQIAQVWYNQTKFNGDNSRQSKAELRQRVINGLNNDFGTTLSNDQFQGTVNGNLMIMGARAVRTYGEETGDYTRLGADFRYVTQRTNELFTLHPDQANLPLIPTDDLQFATNQPHSALTDPGLFAEWGTPWTSFFKTAVGGRVDYVNTHPRTSDYDNTPAAPGVSNVALNQNDVLLASYITSEFELTQEWSIRSGLGYAERVPDLVNRYSDGVFLAILQNGFSKVVGFPALKKERATQADMSAVANYGYMNGRATYFYSWINDYNTYTTFGVDPPTGAQILLAQNTALATLTGFELYGDYKSNDITTFFASMQYVQGTDRVINRPLTQIYPLQSRLGVRWADAAAANNWGFELGFRIVAAQNRIGYLRDDLSATTSTPIETRTGGFYTSYVRGYYNLSQQLHLVGGIDNMFNRNYIEHLDLRLQRQAVTPGGITAALSPGFTAYAGLEWVL